MQGGRMQNQAGFQDATERPSSATDKAGPDWVPEKPQGYTKSLTKCCSQTNEAQLHACSNQVAAAARSLLQQSLRTEKAAVAVDSKALT